MTLNIKKQVHSTSALCLSAAMLLLVVNTMPTIAANKSTGKATVYSKSFQGKKTATGETFKTEGMTAASNKLPLGSKVLVKNKKTGKQAIVKINDKTSKHATAAVDLSPGAAKKIGVNGTAQVETSVVSKGAEKTK